jgi:hypothetical protein
MSVVTATVAGIDAQVRRWELTQNACELQHCVRIHDYCRHCPPRDYIYMCIEERASDAAASIAYLQILHVVSLLYVIVIVIITVIFHKHHHYHHLFKGIRSRLGRTILRRTELVERVVML